MIHIFKSLLVASLLAVQPAASVEAEDAESVVILGGGVGSLTSALYLGRAGLSPVVIEGPIPGGLLTQSHMVQNWPGVMEIRGMQLTDKMRDQAEVSGARFLSEEVISVDFSKRPLTITTKALDGSGKIRNLHALTCIIAMGTEPNYLGIPGEQEYWGKGVTNCAICDGNLYKDRVVGVVGGGDAAILEALYLSNIAKEVYVFVRKGELRAIEEKRIQALKEKGNVHFRYNTTVEEVKGDTSGVTGVVLSGRGNVQEMNLDGLFLAIGSTPNSKIFQNVLKLDDKGYILLEKDQQTSTQGIYAIGDIVDPVYKQAVSAAGDGAKAALQAQQYLTDRENKLVAKRQIVMNQPVHKRVIDVVSEDQFHQELSSSTVPVVVDFYATWCGPCKMVSPMLDNSASQLAGKVKFLKVNVDKLQKLSSKHKVRAMPTVLLFDQGAETERKVGVDQITDLLEELQGQ